MISWFNAPNEGLSPGGQLTLKTLTATENKTYSEEGTAYTSVTVNVEGGGGGDLSTAEVTFDISTGNGIIIDGAIIVTEEGHSFITYGEYVVYNNTKVKCIMLNSEGSLVVMPSGVSDVTVTGDATVYHDGDYYVEMTGDCTITIS